MKTKTYSKTLRRLANRFILASGVKTLMAVSAALLFALCTPPSARGQTVYSVNIVGCVPDITIELLTAPLTTAQRQALHAQNFKQLAPAMRPIYLHAVAYAVGFAVASDGQLPPVAMLKQHLQTVSIYDAPAVPSEYSQVFSAYMAVVKTALKELNVQISDQIANNTSFQQALYAGAVSSIWDWHHDYF